MPDIDFESFTPRARTSNDAIMVRSGAAAPFGGDLLAPDSLFPNGFSIPSLAADPGSPANGLVWYNTTAGEVRMRINGITRIISGTPFAHQNPAAGSYIATITTGMGGATGTIAGVANRMDIFPFIPRADLTIDRLSVNVTTLVAAAQGKIVVYDADASGLPNALIVETATLDFATTGIKEATVALTFRAGVTYWIGMRTSSTATLSAWSTAATPELTTNGITVNPRKLLRRTLTFGTAAPATWGYLVAEVSDTTTAIATAIWLRST